MKKIIVVLFVILICKTNFAQITGNSYAPLRVGDKFVYLTATYTGGPITYTITRNYFTKDTLISGVKYIYSSPLYGGWVRLDTLTNNIVRYAAGNGCGNYPNERVIDSLNAHLNDTIKFCSGSFKNCTELTNKTFFGNSLSTITFFQVMNSAPPTSIITSYTKGIGITSFRSGASLVYSTSSTLKGCVLNGALYGDTSSSTSINLLSLLTPDKFSLSQNYPNPFNPSTRISYELRNSNYVSLKVFDLLGKEVAQLVNEKQNAGSYAVDFNSSEFNLPSGIYFYTLNAGEFKETRKMVLVK